MDIRQLRYFLRIAELRSFTRAADELRVAQPALSRQVKLMEEEFGLHLLHRHGRGVVLTDAGAALQARLSGLVNDFDRISHDMHALGQGKSPQGSMTLGVPISISRQVTMPILNRCRVALPGVVVRVVEGHSELIAESLTSGRVELALLYGDHPRRMIASDVLRRDEIVAVTAADAPWADFASISLQEFERIPLVLPRRPHATWAMLDATGVHPGRVIESDTLLEMLQHVHDGAGVTLLAAGAVEQECAAGTVRIIRPAPPGLSRALVLGRAANHPMPAAAEAVGELIRAEFTAITAG